MFREFIKASLSMRWHWVALWRRVLTSCWWEEEFIESVNEENTKKYPLQPVAENLQWKKVSLESNPTRCKTHSNRKHTISYWVKLKITQTSIHIPPKCGYPPTLAVGAMHISYHSLCRPTWKSSQPPTFLTQSTATPIYHPKINYRN